MLHVPRVAFCDLAYQVGLLFGYVFSTLLEQTCNVFCPFGLVYSWHIYHLPEFVQRLFCGVKGLGHLVPVVSADAEYHVLLVFPCRVQQFLYFPEILNVGQLLELGHPHYQLQVLLCKDGFYISENFFGHPARSVGSILADALLKLLLYAEAQVGHVFYAESVNVADSHLWHARLYLVCHASYERCLSPFARRYQY